MLSTCGNPVIMHMTAVISEVHCCMDVTQVRLCGVRAPLKSTRQAAALL